MPDVESDLSRFHHKDIEDLDSVRFLQFAVRLFAYDGVLAARFRNDQQEPKEPVKRVTNEFSRQKLYKEAGIQAVQVKTTGSDYLREKLKGPVL